MLLGTLLSLILESRRACFGFSMFEDSSRLPGSKSLELAVEDRNRVKVVLVATGFNHWRPQDGPGGTDFLRALVRAAAASTESTGATATPSNVSFGFSSTVALKMNSSSRDARLKCNRAGSHPNPPYPCPDAHGTLPCCHSSRTQPRTPYPRNQAQRTRRLHPADRAWGHSGRGHDPANLQSWMGSSPRTYILVHSPRANTK